MDDIVLGLDPGSNSLGTVVRDMSNDKLSDQIVYYSVDTFESTVIKGVSLAAQRSADSRQRRQHRVRRDRLWATLNVLIKYHLCPLKQEELDAWRIYDKRRGYFRKYPIESKEFAQWITLDFNGDGIPDYSTPFELRHLLVTEKLDFNLRHNRYLLGRAIYHIAQHRGFKSSRLGIGKSSDDVEEQEGDEEDIITQLERSETKKKGKLQAYMDNHIPIIKTVGSAFHLLLTEGENDGTGSPIRVRASEYEAVRSQLYEEIETIFDFQDCLHEETECLDRLLSDKKEYGSIFYINPPRINRKSIGTCILEPDKKRCLESHPEFEKFRAWSFVNTIRIRNSDGVMEPLPFMLREEIFRELFMGRVSDFHFKLIRKLIQKRLGIEKLVFSSEPNKRTINYPDDNLIPACKVTKRLIDLFGDNWETGGKAIEGKRRRGHGKNHPPRQIVYRPMDVWHQCLSIDTLEQLESYARQKLGWTDDDKIDKLKKLWSSISKNRCTLSHKALYNINYFLQQGLGYSDAVFFAKIPDIVGAEAWNSKKNDVFDYIKNGYQSLKDEIKSQSMIVAITNRLIADFKTQTEENQDSDKKRGYDTTLTSDYCEKVIDPFIQRHFGEVTWKSFTSVYRQAIKDSVYKEYTLFLQDPKRDFRKLPKLGEELAKIMVSNYFTDKSLADDFGKLYHPSQISRFRPVEVTGKGMRLGSPSLGNIRNPVYLRAMHILRRKVNALLDAGIIHLEDTRVVLEVPHEINDANMRRAYSLYQSRQEKEKQCILAALGKDQKYTNEEIEKVILLVHSNKNYIGEDTPIEDKSDSKSRNERRYKEWIKEGGICYYTGNPIKLEDLRLGERNSNSKVDVEHTIPRSLLPDNTRKNQTLCFSYYNRFDKGNILPALLPEFEAEISPRLQPIREKVERIKKEISFCQSKARGSSEKNWKDYWIVKRHVWEMELEYWQGKLTRFTAKDVPDDFRRSQLTDTALIAKYAALYLRSIFHRVDVQKGAVTALFRKLYSFQEKDRTSHCHHAIDAAVLSLIPPSAQRDRIIKLYYEREEAEQASEKRRITQEINKEIISARLGLSLTGLQKSVKYIERKIRESVLVNWNTTDRRLKPNKRGDSIRLDLHEKTLHGIVKTVKKETDKKDGTVNVTRIPRPVIRVTLSKLTTTDDIVSFLNNIVDGKLRNYLKAVYDRRKKEGVPLKDILKNIEYGSSKNGKHHPLRHVRCYKDSNLSYERLIPAHHHIFQRDNAPEYKKTTFVKSRENSLLLIYEHVNDKGVSSWIGRYITGFELSKVANIFRKHHIGIISTINDIPEEIGWHSYIDKTTPIEYRLKYVLKPGIRILISEKKQNWKKMSAVKLLKQLRIIVKFNEADGIWLCHHTQVKEYSVEQENGKMKTKRQMSKRKIGNIMSEDLLIEHVHFEINLNTSTDRLFTWL